MRLDVTSEIGKLKSVLVHLPGREIDVMVPPMMAQLLFDDILFGQLAQVFDVQSYELSPLGLIVRSMVNGAAGMVVFETLDRQLRRWMVRA